MDLKEQFHLQQLAKGDRESFVFFHKQYQSKVYYYCLKFVGRQEVAEELTSDVFVKLWEKRHKLRTDISLQGLLYKISRDHALSYLRQIARHTEQRKAFIENYLLTHSNPTEESLFLKEGLEIAERAIDRLPPKCRQVFRLRYLDGLSLHQISGKLQISTNTVQNHLQKGTRLVKGYLEEHSDLVFFLLFVPFF